MWLCLVFGANMYIIFFLFFFSPPRSHLWTNYFYMGLDSNMDSHRLVYPFSTEERSDFDFPVLSTSDIDHWASSDRSLETYCSNDSPGLPSSVQGFSSSSAAIQSRSSYDSDLIHLSSASKLSSSCPSSPRKYGLPESSGSYSPVLLSCPPGWIELPPHIEDEAVDQVPLSSSPPEFTSSSPTSDISSELGKEGSSSLTSASSGRSDTASISSPHWQHSNCGQCQDQFSQRLHDLLVQVLRGRELASSRAEETGFTTCTSRSDDSDYGSDNQALMQTRYSYFGAYICTKALFWGLISHI